MNKYKKEIKQYNCFEELETDELSYYAKLEPIELLKNLKKIVLTSYGIRVHPPFSAFINQIQFKDNVDLEYLE